MVDLRRTLLSGRSRPCRDMHSPALAIRSADCLLAALASIHIWPHPPWASFHLSFCASAQPSCDSPGRRQSRALRNPLVHVLCPPLLSCLMLAASGLAAIAVMLLWIIRVDKHSAPSNREKTREFLEPGESCTPSPSICHPPDQRESPVLSLPKYCSYLSPAFQRKPLQTRLALDEVNLVVGKRHRVQTRGLWDSHSYHLASPTCFHSASGGDGMRHTFLWHQQFYLGGPRPDQGATLHAPAFRFNLTNCLGFDSGKSILMRALVGGLHLRSSANPEHRHVLRGHFFALSDSMSSGLVQFTTENTERRRNPTAMV